MNIYIVNKLLSIAVVSAYIFITYLFFGYTKLQWQFVLIGVLIFGYAHFFVGFYYQIKSFSRLDNPRLHYFSFTILTIVSIFLSLLVYKVLGPVAAMLIGFLYFLFHGTLNERALINRQISLNVPFGYLAALATILFFLLVYSLPDKSFFFNQDLTFQEVNNFMVTYIFNNFYIKLSHLPIIFWSGTGLSFIILLVSWWRNSYTKIALFLTTLFLLITFLVAFFGAPTYIYMYFLIVGYHFVTWLIFYITEMKQRGSGELNKFLIINAAVFLGLILLAIFHFLVDKNLLGNFLFDIRIFMVLTYIHISTSFMNDSWFKAIENKLFNYLS